MRWLVFLSIGCLAAACGSTATGTGSGGAHSACTPKEVVGCDCGGGASGHRTCDDDGSGFGPCDCGAGGSSSGTSGGGAGGCANHLVISEVRTRGPNGEYDEYVEIFNPTKDDYKGSLALSTFKAAIWGKQSVLIPAGMHYLVAGAPYSGSANAVITDVAVGIEDHTYLSLYSLQPQPYQLFDVVCFGGYGYDKCEGTEINNTNDSSTSANLELSMGRLNDCIDTDDNAADFEVGPPTPESL